MASKKWIPYGAGPNLNTGCVLGAVPEENWSSELRAFPHPGTGDKE